MPKKTVTNETKPQVSRTQPVAEVVSKPLSKPVSKPKPASRAQSVAKHNKAATPAQAPIQAPVAAQAPAHEQIAMIAYGYWEARGFQPGSPEQDWLRAEQEFLLQA